MADRDKTDADVDLEFDFFEDLPTVEKAPPEPRRRGGPKPPQPPKGPRAPRGPKEPGGRRGGKAALLRLAALIVAAIAVAVVLVLWVSSCRGDSTSDVFSGYMEDVGGVTQASAAVGRSLTTLFTTPGVTLEEIDTRLGGLTEQQAQVVAQAEELSPPNSLVAEQRSLVDSMQLRESALRGLQRAFAQVQPASDSTEAGALLAEQAQRLLAADVVYDDLFAARSQEVMKQEGVTGVQVPPAPFLTEGDLVTADSLGDLVERITTGGTTTTDGGETAAGLHGNQLVSTKVQPGDEPLSLDQENTVIASDELAFQVLVRNSGDFQETQVEVTLTILQTEPITQTATIPLIDAGESKVATFSDFTNITFATSTTLKVTVEPVAGEQKTDNNTAEYPVIFTLE